MGFLTGGIDYDMIGRVGNHVGRKTKGRNVIGMRPSKSNKPPTALQVAQRQKFGLVTSWMVGIAELIETGFSVHDSAESNMNAAVSYHLKNAVTGVAPNFTMDYEKVMFSRGRIKKAASPNVTIATAGAIGFSWLAGNPSKYNKATDLATVMVYNPSKEEFVTLQAAAPRSALAYNLLVPGDFSGDEVQVYIGFTSSDGKVAGDSTYLGEFTVL
jgi:hypothetical protein